MGMLFSSMWDRLKGGPKQHKIVIIGNANAGKTTTLYKLVLDEAIDTAPTLGSNVEELVYKNIKFVMWDLGGLERVTPRSVGVVLHGDRGHHPGGRLDRSRAYASQSRGAV